MPRKIALSLILTILCHLTYSQAWRDYYDSASAAWSDDWHITSEYLKKSQKIALGDLGIYDPNYVIITSDLGLSLWYEGKPKEALIHLSKALELNNELYDLDHEEVNKSLLNLGNLQAELGNDSLALTFYQRINYTEAHSYIYWSAINAAVDLLTLENVIKAKAYFQQRKTALLTNYPDLPRHDLIEVNFLTLKINLTLNDHVKSEILIKQLSKSVPLDNSENRASNLVRLNYYKGRVSLARKKFSLAEVAFKQVLKISHPEMGEYTSSLALLAELYRQSGNYQEASNYYHRALKNCENYNYNYYQDCRLLKNNLASLYLDFNKSDSASLLYNEILASGVGKYKDSIYYAVLFGQGILMINQNRLNEAQDHFGAMKNDQNIQRDTLLLGNLYHHLGLIALLRKELEPANDHFKKALNYKRNYYHDESIELRSTINHLALISWELGEFDLSIQYLEQVLQLIQKEINFVFPSLTLIEQASYYQDLKVEFERFYSLVISSLGTNHQFLKKLYQHQIQMKGLLFNFEKQRTKLVSNVNDESLSLYHQQLKDTRKEVASYYLSNTPNTKRSASIIDSLQRKTRELEKNISTYLPELATTEIPSWSVMQQSLQEDEAFVNIVQFRKFASSEQEWVKGDDQLRFGFTDSIFYAALVTTTETKEAPLLVLLKYGNYLETRANYYLNNAITFNVKDQNSYQYYWEPIDKVIEDKKRVYVCNDGIFNTINIATVYDHERKTYMIDKYEIVYTLNPGRKVVPQTLSSLKSRQITLFGNPDFGSTKASGSERNAAFRFEDLPGTALELRQIEKKFLAQDWTVNTMSQKEANKSNLEGIETPDVLHIATHGFYKENQYFAGVSYSLLNAGLAMASSGAGKESSQILTAYEASNLPLYATNLVTLSACETGVGRLENGEGIYSLQRAFLTAGAKRVITSLWKVDDNITADFMSYYYGQLINGKTYQEALTASQLYIKSKVDDPKSWGGFILVAS